MQDASRSRLDALAELLAVIDRLRAPDGCPWDREQTETSMAPHLLEEAYEAVEALQDGDAESSCEELGDVLMNVLMIARIASESSGRYDIEGVARGIAAKLVRRHPHVFGDADATDTDAVLATWERIKLAEKSDAVGAEPEGRPGVLAGLPADLPGLLRAFRIGEKVGRVGFDWPDSTGPRDKVREELAELDAAIATGVDAQIEAEVGDLLFAVANLARHHGVNPEMALRRTNGRFGARFAYVESALGEQLGSATLDRMEELWDEAKAQGIGVASDLDRPASGG